MSGLVGRGVTLRAAARVADIHAVDALGRLAGQFERMVRIPSLVVLRLGLWAVWRAGWPILGFLQGRAGGLPDPYLSLVPLIGWVFLPRGRRFEEAPRGALVQGCVTSALTEAFADPVVAAAHAWELIAIGLIIVLMVTKPF